MTAEQRLLQEVRQYVLEYGGQDRARLLSRIEAYLATPASAEPVTCCPPGKCAYRHFHPEENCPRENVPPAAPTLAAGAEPVEEEMPRIGLDLRPTEIMHIHDLMKTYAARAVRSSSYDAAKYRWLRDCAYTEGSKLHVVFDGRAIDGEELDELMRGALEPIDEAVGAALTPEVEQRECECGHWDCDGAKAKAKRLAGERKR